MRGLSFEIPNRHGRYLYEILEAIDISDYFWKSEAEEAYYIENNQLDEAMFPQPSTYTGEELYNRISVKDYYVLFAVLKAFKDKSHVQDIATYKEFLNSQCELVLLIVECAYVTVYAKDLKVTERIYKKADQEGYGKLTYITDVNDPRTTLTPF